LLDVNIDKITAPKRFQMVNYSIWFRKIILSIFVATLLYSCSPTRRVPENEYLLDKAKIKIDQGKINKDELKNYVRQKSNKRILGVRFHLWLYNMANPEKQKGISGWLRRIGEEPVIYDEYLKDKSEQQLKSYLNSKGYFNAQVDDTVYFRRKRVRVNYHIKANEPIKIRSLSYIIQDKAIEPIIMGDTPNSLVKIGGNFDTEMLQEERQRLELLLKQKGYYNFNKQYITYLADSSSYNLSADLTLIIKEFQQTDTNKVVEFKPHKKYKINKVFVYTDFEPRQALLLKEKYYNSFDTIYDKGIYFINQPTDKTSRKIIFQSNFIKEGAFYNLNNVNSTYQHLNGLQLFKLINIQFTEIDSSANDSLAIGYLDCSIQLTKYFLQSYTLELQGTNSSGNIGVGGNILYQHRSLFGGAEVVDFKVNGSIETLNEQIRRIDNTIELGGDITINIPKFLLPFFTAEEFSKKYKPKTQISLGYNYQDRPDYQRTIANFSYGYTWDENRSKKHSIRLVEFNAVKLPFVTNDFKTYIEKTLLSSSYENHLVSVTSYSFILNNQDIRKNRDFSYLRVNTELSGNILTAFNQLTDAPKVDGGYQVFGIPYSQYFKADIDFRYYQILNETNNFVYRLFIGGAVPYGNSQSIPFEKKYFSGGANSIRAWNVRDLGPGSYMGDTISKYPNQSADLKLEANFEYRFKLFWILESALFLDAGNIWSIKEDNREGAFFKKDEFYKEIALGTGLGFRFDLSFVILRLDIGLKLRDPSLPSDQRWILGNRPFVWDDLTFNIGIGYPF
jgi:outer membrane protein assembly factor BamA